MVRHDIDAIERSTSAPPGPTLLDDPGGLVAEPELVGDPALAVVQVGVTHPHARTCTAASPRPEFAITIVLTETGSPFLCDTTPGAGCGMATDSLSNL